MESIVDRMLCMDYPSVLDRISKDRVFPDSSCSLNNHRLIECRRVDLLVQHMTNHNLSYHYRKMMNHHSCYWEQLRVPKSLQNHHMKVGSKVDSMVVDS
jgi:hypothetical protein